MPSSLNLDTLPAALTNYVSEHYDSVLSTLLSAEEYLKFLQYFGTKLQTNDKISLTELVLGDIVQPGQKDTFNPTVNAIQFKARIGEVRPMKVDLKLTPSKVASLWKSYLGKVSGGVIDPTKIPFEQFVLGGIIKKAHENIRRAVFKGEYNAAADGVLDTVDGIIAQIDKPGAVPAGNKVAVPAVLTVANIGDAVDALVQAIDSRYWDEDMVLVMEPRHYRMYCKWFQNTNGSLVYNEQFKQVLIDGTSIRLISEPGMVGTNRMFATKPENLVWLYDATKYMKLVNIEYAERNIKMMMDWQCAPDFAIGELVWTTTPTP